MNLFSSFAVRYCFYSGGELIYIGPGRNVEIDGCVEVENNVLVIVIFNETDILSLHEELLIQYNKSCGDVKVELDFWEGSVKCEDAVVLKQEDVSAGTIIIHSPISYFYNRSDSVGIIMTINDGKCDDNNMVVIAVVVTIGLVFVALGIGLVIYYTVRVRRKKQRQKVLKKVRLQVATAIH